MKPIAGATSRWNFISCEKMLSFPTMYVFAFTFLLSIILFPSNPIPYLLSVNIKPVDVGSIFLLLL